MNRPLPSTDELYEWSEHLQAIVVAEYALGELAQHVENDRFRQALLPITRRLALHAQALRLAYDSAYHL